MSLYVLYSCRSVHTHAVKTWNKLLKPIASSRSYSYLFKQWPSHFSTFRKHHVCYSNGDHDGDRIYDLWNIHFRNITESNRTVNSKESFWPGGVISTLLFGGSFLLLYCVVSTLIVVLTPTLGQNDTSMPKGSRNTPIQCKTTTLLRS